MCMNVILVKVIKMWFYLETSEGYSYPFRFTWDRYFETYIKNWEKRSKLILLTQKRDLKWGYSRIEPITAIGRSY